MTRKNTNILTKSKSTQAISSRRCSPALRAVHPRSLKLQPPSKTARSGKGCGNGCDNLSARDTRRGSSASSLMLIKLARSSGEIINELAKLLIIDPGRGLERPALAARGRGSVCIQESHSRARAGRERRSPAAPALLAPVASAARLCAFILRQIARVCARARPILPADRRSCIYDFRTDRFLVFAGAFAIPPTRRSFDEGLC